MAKKHHRAHSDDERALRVHAARDSASKETPAERETGLAAGPDAVPAAAPLRGLDILALEQTLGNTAVRGMLQPPLQRAEAEPDEAEGAHSDPTLALAVAAAELQLQQVRRWIAEEKDPDTLSEYRQLEAAYAAFPGTYVAPLRVLSANVMVDRAFMGQSVDTLRRGEEVTVLAMHDVWCRVLTPRGKVGWLHRLRLFPPVLAGLRSGETGSGSTRDDVPTTGRRG